MADRNNMLLQWAAENPNPDKKLDVEKSKEFIQNLDPQWYQALGMVSGKDNDIKRMRKIIEQLNDEQSSEEDICELLEDLNFVCELSHNAIDLHKLDGLEPVLDLMQHETAEVRMHAAWVVGTCMPNNPRFQQFILDLSAFPFFLDAILSDSSADVRKKALLCISGFVRNFPEGLKLFLESDGISAVVKLLTEDGLNTRRKAAFLLLYLIEMDVPPSSLHAVGGIRALLEACRVGDDDLCENCLQCIRHISSNKGESDLLQECNYEEILRLVEENFAEEPDTNDELPFGEEIRRLIAEIRAEMANK
eukprot:50362_1